MNTVKTIITHEGVEYSAQVMTIKRTTLGLEDHGVWTAYLHCEGDGSGIGVGGYVLDSRPAESTWGDGKRRHGTAFGMDHIMALTQTVGVDDWEQLPGRKVYVLFELTGNGRAISNWGSSAVGIANIDTGKALILKAHAEMWRLKA